MQAKIAVIEMGNDPFRKYMKSKYTASLKRAGAAAVWISCEQALQRRSLLESCDGLLLPGGADIDPGLYGRQREKESAKANALRDEAEVIYLEHFLKTEKPIFGICRGLQMINVYFGGTLIQSIEADERVKHMDFFARGRACHKVEIQADSLLFDIVGEPLLGVNSMHHQAIDELAPGLSRTAVSEDGFIEAVEKKDHPFLLGVQWHPEHMSKKDKAARALFEAFVEKCMEQRRAAGL